MESKPARVSRGAVVPGPCRMPGARHGPECAVVLDFVKSLNPYPCSRSVNVEIAIPSRGLRQRSGQGDLVARRASACANDGLDG